MVKSLVKEIRLRKDYLAGDKIETIYFGGGTPSVLSIKELKRIINQIEKYHTIDYNAECTLECNPDDLSIDYLKALYNETKINRLSIGVQSFFDDDLKLMNRRHSGNEAEEALKNASKIGFTNITADLIYGLPNMTIDRLSHNINTLLQFKVNHISAYHLTVEPNTAFNHFVKQKKIVPVTDSESVEQFKYLTDTLKANSFVHYEISNFGKGKFISKHNVNYWKQKKYIGIGPSAHSYNLHSRQWNISHNQKYIDSITKNVLPAEKEVLDITTQYNEYVMTTIRTMWGINMKYVETQFGEIYYRHCLMYADKYLISNDLIKLNNFIVLSDKGKFISDTVMADLFYV